MLTHPFVEKWVKSTGCSWETGKKAVIPGLTQRCSSPEKVWTPSRLDKGCSNYSPLISGKTAGIFLLKSLRTGKHVKSKGSFDNFTSARDRQYCIRIILWSNRFISFLKLSVNVLLNITHNYLIKIVQ